MDTKTRVIQSEEEKIPYHDGNTTTEKKERDMSREKERKREKDTSVCVREREGERDSHTINVCMKDSSRRK